MIKKELVVQKDPKAPVSEVFRTLRTNIQFMNTSKNLKTLLITSCVSGEGKSWVSANLAATFAQANKKVVLVDCDMRKGRQHNLFNVSVKPGLSNYLSGINFDGEDSDDDLSKYIRDTEVENLYLIPAGNIPPNPSELIASENMIRLLEDLKKVCDIVILDGTPSLIVTDAIILSRFVDSTIIVSSQNQTKLDDLNRVKRDIDNVGGKIAGVVINKIEVSSRQYNDRYYYYGHKSNLPTKKNEKYRENTRKQKEAARSKRDSGTEDDLRKTQEILSSLDTYLKNEKEELERKKND